MPTKSAALKVAVVGAGSIGREYALFHFGAATNTVVTSVVDTDAKLARLLATDVGSAQAGAAVVGKNRYKADVKSLAGKPVLHASELTNQILDACDIVYVGTTPSAHKGLVLQALDAKKHVLLEKPLASTADDADAIVRAAESAQAACGLRVGMNIGMRYNEALSTMRRLLLDERPEGAARRVHDGGAAASSPSASVAGGSLSLHFTQWPRDWQQVAWCAGRSDGGALRECGTHYLFAVLELFGATSVKRVRATVTYPDGPSGTQAESAVEGTLELDGGLQLELSVRTDGTGLAADGEDHYELELEMSSGTAYQLHDFVCLRKGACDLSTRPKRWKQVVANGAYGRTECVAALCNEIRRAQAEGCGDGAGGGAEKAPSSNKDVDAPLASPRLVTAREGRNVQRVLDGILASRGRWLEIKYD